MRSTSTHALHVVRRSSPTRPPASLALPAPAAQPFPASTPPQGSGVLRQRPGGPTDRPSTRVPRRCRPSLLSPAAIFCDYTKCSCDSGCPVVNGVSLAYWLDRQT